MRNYNTELKIHEVAYEDEKNYTCYAESSYAPSEDAVITLDVQCKGFLKLNNKTKPASQFIVI